MTTLRRCSPEIERELHDKEARIRELEAALRPFVDAFGSQDWYRRRHDVNVLSEMLCLPVPITPDDIERACKELAAPAPPDSEPAEGAGHLDAGDALRRALSDPETMQRVTERAAERQDAMLGRRDALDACDELDAWLDQLIDFASAAPPSKKRCIERIRRALSTGVPEAFRRTIAFAQEECQEPSVMHVSDMARLIRDYAQAELDRALPQPQEGESDGL